MEPFDPLTTNDIAWWDDFAAQGRAIGIDAWCSRPVWGLAVHRSFAGVQDSVVSVTSDAGLGVFGRIVGDDETPALVPLDRIWGFGSPIVCSPGAAETVVGDVADQLVADPLWRVCALSGMAVGGELDRAVIRGFGRHVSLFAGETRSRCRASLDGGVDGYLAHRTREHRRNIRQAERRAVDAGLSFVVDDGGGPAGTIARLHAVEHRSWKGLEGSGIESPEMAALYEHLVRDLSASGALRCVFAQAPVPDGPPCDVGFILGGVLGDTYRGLQISFVEEFRHLGVGNLLQWHEVQRMCIEQLRVYDLGMDIGYKRRWAEELFETRTVIAVRQ